MKQIPLYYDNRFDVFKPSLSKPIRVIHPHNFYLHLSIEEQLSLIPSTPDFYKRYISVSETGTYECDGFKFDLVAGKTYEIITSECVDYFGRFYKCLSYLIEYE